MSQESRIDVTWTYCVPHFHLAELPPRLFSSKGQRKTDIESSGVGWSDEGADARSNLLKKAFRLFAHCGSPSGCLKLKCRLSVLIQGVEQKYPMKRLGIAVIFLQSLLI